MWCQTEELQTKMTIIHSLENRLTAINEEHEAEMQRQTPKVHFLHVSKKVVQIRKMNCDIQIMYFCSFIPISAAETGIF